MFRVLMFLVLVATLTACSSVKVRDRVGVKEAKACVKAKAADKIILEQYKIKACTSNGVWVVVSTETGDEIDFVNKEFLSPLKNAVNFDELEVDQAAFVKGLRKTINNELLDIYY